MKSLLGPKPYNIINWKRIAARQEIVLEDDVLRSERHTFFPENLFLNQLLIYLTVSTLIIDRSNLEEKIIMNTYI